MKSFITRLVRSFAEPTTTDWDIIPVIKMEIKFVWRAGSERIVILVRLYICLLF